MIRYDIIIIIKKAYTYQFYIIVIFSVSFPSGQHLKYWYVNQICTVCESTQRYKSIPAQKLIYPAYNVK